MSINKVQQQKGFSMFDLIEHYGTEDQCEAALFKWRWPQGFVCKECQSTDYCRLNKRKLYQCNKCRHQVSLISNTLFSSTNSL